MPNSPYFDSTKKQNAVLRFPRFPPFQITPAFKCSGVWPRSAAHWPLPQIPWPHPNLVAEVKTEGFDLLSKECLTLQGKQSAMEGDAWVISFFEAENR